MSLCIFTGSMLIAGTAVPPAGMHNGSILVPEYVEALLPPSVFHLEVFHWSPPAHPDLYVTWPELIPGTPHTFGKQFPCVVSPTDGGWSAENNTIADYVDFTSIWLVKYEVWTQIQQWIGHEASHDEEVLRRTNPNAQCFCGSGYRYKDCHGRDY